MKEDKVKKIIDLECCSFGITGWKNGDEVMTNTNAKFGAGNEQATFGFQAEAESTTFEVGKRYRITIEELDGEV
jgi:hypothetical protein